MLVIKPLTQGFLQKFFEDRQRYYLSASIFSIFTFEVSSRLLSEIDLWKFVAGELRGTILDSGMPKHRGEVLVIGKCFAPDGKPVSACHVRLRIGSIEKILSVFGDRFWNRKAGLFKIQSDPMPFKEMPISYENAFGGPGFKENPLGKGHASVEQDDGRKIHPLPNIEMPGNLIDSPKKKPDPAGFGPLDPMWPQRMKKSGAYDKEWQKERFPGFPADMDPTFFNMAPLDQQIEGFFQGDEAFEIENMHPEKSLIQGRLPAIRSRCFINRKSGNGELFEEIETRLDTVWLFPHAEKGVIIHRAVTEVATDDAEDILHLMLGYERLGDNPKSFEHYRNAFLKRIDSEKGHLYALDEKDLIPPGEKSGIAALVEKPGEGKESALSQNVARKAEIEKEKAKESIRQLGLDPEQFFPDKPPDTPKPGIENLGEIEDFAQKMEADALAKKAELEQTLKKTLAAQGMNYDRLIESAKKMSGGMPKFSAEKQIEQLRQFGFSNPEIEKKLFQAEETVKDAYRQFAHHFPPAPLPSAGEALQMRETVLAGYREGRSFAGHDLTGIDLSGLDLKNIDLKEAFLEGANLSNADLSNANCTRTVLARAELSGARFSEARMAEACLGAAKIVGANLTGADLSRAAFGKADLTDSDLSGATLDGADFMEAILAGSCLNGATLQETTFLDNDLSGAHFIEADAARCVFINAKIERTDFSKAKLGSAVFVGVKASETSFAGADLTKACATNEASFTAADFRDAILNQAGMRGCDFSGANFDGAQLEMADLSECNLKGANLHRVLARQARFEKSNLEDADMSAINLFEGSLMKARLVRTNLRGANLFSTECMRAVLEETDLSGANLKKTKIAELDKK